MEKKTLLVDMDGVLADVYAHFITYEFQETGIKKTKEEVVGLPEREAFTTVKYVRSEGFFRTVPVMPDSQEVLEKLNSQYQLYIVSSAMEFPNSLREKYDWLEEHFPFIHWRQIILCGDKKAVFGDIMVDDHFKNLDYFSGKTFLFNQPHSQLADSGKHERVFSWKELGERLLN